MDGEKEFIESLNRTQRRMILRHTKAVSSGLTMDCKETVKNVTDMRAQAILKKEKPFSIELDGRESDIYMEATYLACMGLTKEDLGKIKSMFFEENPLSKLESVQALDVSEEELDLLSAIAQKTGKEAEFYTLYSMSRLCDRAAMQVVILSLVSITIYEIMQRTYSHKCVERDKNGCRRVPKPVVRAKEERLLDNRVTPLSIEYNSITDKLRALIMAKMLYWAGKKGFLNKSQFDSELSIMYKDSFSAFVNLNLGSCGEYSKWVAGEETLYDTMRAEGDTHEISSAEREFTRQYLKNIRANLVCEYAFSSKLSSLESEVVILGKNNEELKNKYQNIKKLRSEDLRKSKELASELASLKRHVAKQSKTVKGCDGELDELRKNIEGLEERISELKEKLAGCSRQKEILSEANTSLLERNEELETKLKESEDMCRNLRETLGELTQQEMDTDIPLEVVVKGIAELKLAICGGKEHIVANLEKMGIQQVKHIPVGKIVTAPEIGQFDCLVIVTKYVAHKSVFAIKEKAKSLGKVVVHFNGSNIELLCRQIFEATR